MEKEKIIENLKKIKVGFCESCHDLSSDGDYAQIACCGNEQAVEADEIADLFEDGMGSTYPCPFFKIAMRVCSKHNEVTIEDQVGCSVCWKEYWTKERLESPILTEQESDTHVEKS